MELIVIFAQILFPVFTVRVCALEFVCPNPSQWKFRAHTFCNSTHPEYYCLYDQNRNTYVEQCKKTPDFQRPGYKFIISGALHGVECDEQNFQPFKLWSNVSSGCLFAKSKCEAEGQILVSEGNPTSDAACRCDYTTGYAFITKPKSRNCACFPSLEDCTRYKMVCSYPFVITPDYKCVRTLDWTGTFECSAINKNEIGISHTETTECPENIRGIDETTSGWLNDVKGIVLLFVVLCLPTSIGAVFITECLRKKILNMIESVHKTQMESRNKPRQSERLKECLEKHYDDIVSSINPYTVTEYLTSKQLLSESDSDQIKNCFGLRLKNRKLLEIICSKPACSLNDFLAALQCEESNEELAHQIEQTNARLMSVEPTDEKVEFKKDHNEKIPVEMREFYETHICKWRTEDKKFVVTNAAKEVEKILAKFNCVVVIGCSGSGKTSLLRHIALIQHDEHGFDIVPIVQDPSTIFTYRNDTRRQIFIVDDMCGKSTPNVESVDLWHSQIDKVISFLEKPTESKYSRLRVLFAVPLAVYNEDLFKRRFEEKIRFCSISLAEFPLTIGEKTEIMNIYMKTEASNKLKGYDEMYFPFLCKLSEGRTTAEVKEIFSDPFNFIKSDLESLHNNSNIQFCLIAICAFLNGFKEEIFNNDFPHGKGSKVKEMFTEFGVFDLDKESSRKKFREQLKILLNTYLDKYGDSIHFKHDIINTIATVSCGQVYLSYFIKHAPTTSIAERFRFSSLSDENHNNEFILVDETHEKIYFDRLVNDLKEKNTYSMLHNTQLEFTTYRSKLCEYCLTRKGKVATLLSGLKDNGKGPLCSETDSNEDYVNFTEKYHFSSYHLRRPMIESVWEGYTEIVQMMLEMKVDINEQDRFKRTPLHIGCAKNKKDAVDLLLKNGADYTLRDYKDRSPLLVACQEGFKDIAKILLKKKERKMISVVDVDGRSPLFAACEMGHPNVVETLIDAGADITQSDRLNQSPLFIAALRGRRRVVEILIKKNADVNKCNENGYSPLFVACLHEKKHIINLLLKANAKISQCDNDGRTPLFIACKQGYTDIVRELISNRADIKKCDWHDNSPLYIACSKGYLYIVEALVEQSDINHRNEDGKTPLFIGCEKGYEEIATILLENGANVNLCDNKKRSPLFIASKGGHENIVKKLCEKRARISLSNQWNNSPLFAACREGHYSIAKYLIDNKGDVSQVDIHGMTPLSIACEEGHLQISKLLIEHGADINKRDNENRRPIDFATAGDYKKIIDLLNDTQKKIKKGRKTKHH